MYFIVVVLFIWVFAACSLLMPIIYFMILYRPTLSLRWNHDHLLHKTYSHTHKMSLHIWKKKYFHYSTDRLWNSKSLHVNKIHYVFRCVDLYYLSIEIIYSRPMFASVLTVKNV